MSQLRYFIVQGYTCRSCREDGEVAARGLMGVCDKKKACAFVFLLRSSSPWAAAIATILATMSFNGNGVS